jgi:hypothetical protein
MVQLPMLQYPSSLVFLRNLYSNSDTIFLVWKRAYLLSFLQQVERTVYSLNRSKQIFPKILRPTSKLEMKFCAEDLGMLGTTIQNLVTHMAWHP